MKNNKEKLILSLLILFQIIFICYQIYNTMNENISTSNPINYTYKNNEVNGNTKNKTISANDNLTSSNENNTIKNDST